MHHPLQLPAHKGQLFKCFSFPHLVSALVVDGPPLGPTWQPWGQKTMIAGVLVDNNLGPLTAPAWAPPGQGFGVPTGRTLPLCLCHLG